MDSLHNYRELVSRVDALCRRIENDFREHLACRKGCSSCCRHLSLSRVEAAALSKSLHGLSPERAAHIRERAGQAGPDDPCPLLEDGACLLYEARPLICRTHGLPVMVKRDERKSVDFCPENFRDLTSLPARAVIELDTLNATLAAIDGLFTAENRDRNLPERPTIAEALLFDWR
ncbi:MAG TPA: YkgJ family cysteine cluster protein [Desulfuromonadales bacterium]|nr:YkgJ family cysteine cluster protein [Desulfuromonadales bacterium]